MLCTEGEGEGGAACKRQTGPRPTKKQKQHSLLRVNVTLEHYRLGTYTHAHINGICTLKSASGISMRKGEIAGGRGG